MMIHRHTWLRVLPVSIVLGLGLTTSLFTGPGCANMSPPMGGAKDSLPPVFLTAEPKDSSKNVTPKKITLVFDEYVQLENISEQLIIVPTPKINPIITSKLKTITITIKDTLQPHTTYALDFGNAIKDINENNVLKNFSYVFSTGAYIDSGSLSGSVVLAESGKTDSTLIVVLYRNGEDSAVVKERPRYVTRLNGKGLFTFRFLPHETFSVYAFKDEGGQRRYLSPSQLFAFNNTPVSISDSTSSLTLYAYVEKSSTESAAASATRMVPAAKAAVTDKRLRIENNLENGEQDLLQPLRFYFRAAPLKTFDSTKVIFTDEEYRPLTSFQLLKDTSNASITLVTKWTENTGYAVIVKKEFATDTAGRTQLTDDTLHFRTRKNSFYGSVRLRFTDLSPKKNQVVQFIKNNEVAFSYPLSTNEFTNPLFPPGEYEIRVLEDDNGNGKWDTGSFFGVKKQPERVRPVDRKLTIKGNWDNEVELRVQ